MLSVPEPAETVIGADAKLTTVPSFAAELTPTAMSLSVSENPERPTIPAEVAVAVTACHSLAVVPALGDFSFNFTTTKSTSLNSNPCAAALSVPSALR